MEKISGIIASNARTRSVDVSNAQPVRPGAPSYGRPEGKVTKAMVEDKISLSSVATDRPIEAPNYKNTNSDSAKVKIIKESADRFFETRVPQTLAKETDAPLSEEMLEKIPESSLSSVKPSPSSEANA